MKGFLPRTLHPGIQLLLLVGLLAGAFCVVMFLILVYTVAKLDLGVNEMQSIMARPASYPQGWEFSMVSQGILLLVGFGGAAVALAALVAPRVTEYFAPRRVPLVAPLVAALLIIVSLPLMSGLVQWNQAAHFPAFLHDFEVYARGLEDRAAELTKYLTRFSSPGRLLLGLLVIAVVPAIAEELCFRGVIQKNLVRWFGSRHVGVWLAAAIFSAIHFQFFGFVPRFVLGLVLGYLYEWSGNILVPMAAHFTQNAFQLLLLYAQQRGLLSVDFDPDRVTSLPWYLVLLSGLLSAALLYWLHQRLAPAAPTVLHTISSSGVAVAAADAPVPAARTIGRDGVRAEEE